jgi:L-seryl-tRNA(Ser) seleniumtransferase
LAITRLPQVDRILRQPQLTEMQTRVRRELLTDLVRQQLDELRNSPAATEQDADAEAIALSVCKRAEQLLRPSLRKVINGTGVVLNTNLGRAPLSGSALRYLEELGGGYCNLEIDLQSGKRGKRSARINDLLRLITGAEAGMVVNNNAAAVLLAVNALAKDKEVVVSRGELIEIGGSFRLPDVIESAGGILKEVGTTNRTRLADFKNALSEKTGLFVRCHRSNFEIRGFTEQVNLEELTTLSKECGVPVLEDLGSGVLLDLGAQGLSEEPTVREVVRTGCDLIAFSGDKLLGGPQAGIVVGKKAMVDRLARHPLYRALRLDKISLALLEQTLTAYLSPAPEKLLPVLHMVRIPVEQLQMRAEKFASTICDGSAKIDCKAINTSAAAGGGSLPGESMHSYGITLSVKGIRPVKLAELLRTAEPPVISIVQNDQVILDFRTISDAEERLLAAAILALVAN